jgi:DNA-binding transcriptional LysR family regulator
MSERAPSPATSWDHYRSFLAVLDEGSLSGAARALGLRQPTIGRHIDALEAAHKTPLFTRAQDGLTATEAALELRAYAETMAAMADAMVRATSAPADAVRGTVRISASEMIGTEVLPPILAGLRHRHPGLTVELVLSNRIDDLLRRQADIAVRMVRPKQEALLARRIGEIKLGLHARRDYLDHHGTPKTLADLAGHAVIGFDREYAFVRVLRDHGLPLKRDQFALRTDSDTAHFACIRAGVGIGICQVGLARRHPDLVRILPRAFDYPMETWIAMHEDLKPAARCRVTFDALADGLSDYIKPPKVSRAPGET